MLLVLIIDPSIPITNAPQTNNKENQCNENFLQCFMLRVVQITSVTIAIVIIDKILNNHANSPINNAICFLRSLNAYVFYGVNNEGLKYINNQLVKYLQLSFYFGVFHSFEPCATIERSWHKRYRTITPLKVDQKLDVLRYIGLTL